MSTPSVRMFKERFLIITSLSPHLRNHLQSQEIFTVMMVSNAKIPASYNSRTVFNKTKATFMKAIRSNIEWAISAHLLKVYQDNPGMHCSLLSNAEKFGLMIQKMKDMVSSREGGSMLVKDFLPNVEEMTSQEEVESQEEEVKKEEYPSMVIKLEPSEIKEELMSWQKKSILSS